jgi:hypothetical protein
VTKLIKIFVVDGMTYVTTWFLSDMFSIKNGLIQGDASLPLLFNFALECAIRMFQVN